MTSTLASTSRLLLFVHLQLPSTIMLDSDHHLVRIPVLSSKSYSMPACISILFANFWVWLSFHRIISACLLVKFLLNSWPSLGLGRWNILFWLQLCFPARYFTPVVSKGPHMLGSQTKPSREKGGALAGLCHPEMPKSIRPPKPKRLLVESCQR